MFRHSSPILLSFVAAASCVVSPLLYGQLGTAVLSGQVTDPSGASIPSAHLKLQSTQKKFTLEVTTGADGSYVISATPPGSYLLEVTSAGFKNETFTDIGLSSGQASTLNATLHLAAASEQVTVTQAPPLLQTTNATVGSVVEPEEIHELPLLGRNFTSLLRTLPAVAPIQSPDARNNSISGTGQNPSIYGQRQRGNDFMMDGGSDNDIGGDDIAIYPPPEAIAEVKVESAMTEGAHGKASGASINVVTRSGTNEFHGDLWESLRNNDMDARSFFVPAVGAYRWNQFGGTIGGPVAIPHVLSRDKGWYFFGYYEGVRIHNAANYTNLVPTANELGGNFSGDAPIYDPYTTTTVSGKSTRQPFANNQIPASQLNASALTIAKAIYPAPNLPTGQIPGVNFINTTANRTQADQWSMRVDHQFGPHDNFYARFSDSNLDSTTNGLPAVPSDATTAFKTLIASETHTFSPTFLATARFGIVRRNRGGTPGIVPNLPERAGTLAAFPAYKSPNTGQVYDVFPGLVIAGYAGLSESVTLPSPETQIFWFGDVTRTHGSHTIQFGGNFQIYDHDSLGLPSQGVNFDSNATSNYVSGTGLSMASYLLGLPSTASRTIGSSDGIIKGNMYGLYAQDTYRVTKKLTLNLGIRYDYASPTVNSLGSSGFIYETGYYYWNQKNPITGQAANISPGVIPPDRHNFAPRVGVAYQVTTKTVVRAGFGIYYDIISANYSQTQQGNRGNWPFASPESVTGLNTGVPTAFLPNPFPGPAQASLVPLGFNQNLNAFPSTSRTPYVEEWTMSVQQQLGKSVTFESTYFGSHGLKLVGQIVDNTAVTPGPGPYQSRQLYPNLPPYVSNGQNVFPSYYDGLSLKIDKRFASGLTLSGSYTWSKNIDYIDSMANNGAQSEQDPTRFNIAQFKGPAGFDVAQRLVFSYVYEIPVKTGSSMLNAVVSHWSVSGVSSFDTGFPYGAVVNFDNENIGSAGRSDQFPNVVGNPNAIAVRTPQQWFNTAAFAVPGAYTAGNAGHNTLTSQGMRNSDFSLYKKWPFQERRSVELRGEFFDVLNQTTFSFPGNQLQTAQFGKISTTRNSGRQAQVALKIHF